MQGKKKTRRQDPIQILVDSDAPLVENGMRLFAQSATLTLHTTIDEIRTEGSQARLREAVELSVAEAAPTETSAPPQVAEFFLTLILSKKAREAVLGDMEEIFQRETTEIGSARARLRYSGRALRELLPPLVRFAKRI